MGHSVAGSTLIVGLVVATYAALLAMLGFAGRAILANRRRETVAENRVRRRVRKLRRSVRQIEVDLVRLPALEHRQTQLGEDLAVLVAEVEALHAWRAAVEQGRRPGDPGGRGVP